MDRYVWEIVVLGRVSSIMGAHSHFRLMVELNKDPSSNRTLTITNADAQYYCKHVFQWSLVFRMPSDISSYMCSVLGLSGCFRKRWYPQIIHFNRDFHYKPSILGVSLFSETPIWFPSHVWNSMSDVLTWLSLRNSEVRPLHSTGGNSEGPAMFQ